MRPIAPMTIDEARTLIDMLYSAKQQTPMGVYLLIEKLDPKQKEILQREWRKLWPVAYPGQPFRKGAYRNALAEALSIASQHQPTVMAYAYYEAERRQRSE